MQLKEQSGFKWDEQHGVDIDSDSESVWDTYMIICSPSSTIHFVWLTSAWQKNPKAGPFQNCGWVHYMSMQSLILTQAKEVNIFCTGQDSGEETTPP